MEHKTNAKPGDSITLKYSNSPQVRVERILFDENGSSVYVCSWFTKSGNKKTENFDDSLVEIVHHLNGTKTISGHMFPESKN